MKRIYDNFVFHISSLQFLMAVKTVSEVSILPRNVRLEKVSEKFIRGMLMLFCI